MRIVQPANDVTPNDQTKVPSEAQALFEQLLVEQSRRSGPVDNFGEFERELHARMAEIELKLLAEELQRQDVDVTMVQLEGVAYRRVLRCTETYLSAAGPVQVERTLYANRAESERAVCPMELRAGIVEGHWTPVTAEQAMWMVSHLTPQESAQLCTKLGRMQPSKSSLDRLLKQLSGRWEEQRQDFESQLRGNRCTDPTFSIPWDVLGGPFLGATAWRPQAPGGMRMTPTGAASWSASSRALVAAQFFGASSM
ncbi:hypothetical protein [Chondromyces crocatus]|uniref:Uncharacterized protein n=1 Tax=Chondromyces crocatus TaxID=52 RepID=A0A0K1EAF3_CHOCO|nr:hypothetical protein [Chondromyces crocatus]AKT37834.1 uncharacterized protein CMC5_019770 [Chondromyces crocatus]